MNMRILLGLLAAAAIAVLQSSAATTYQVGDNFGWNTPTGNAFNFTNWAGQYTFVLDDILVFNFATGQHTASRVNQADYSNCNIRGNPISIQTNGPANFTLNQTGPWYFICTESNHCSSGQRLLVNVTNTNNSSVQSPPPPPGSSSSPSDSNSSEPPPPPSPNSAYGYLPSPVLASLTFFFTAMAVFF